MNHPIRVAILATHPIQYQAPLYRALAAMPGLDVVVYYVLIPSAEQQGTGFGVPFEWDVPLLEGYRWERLPGAPIGSSLDSFWKLRLHGFSRCLRSRRPDVLLLPGWNSVSLVQGAALGRLFGIPMVVRAESNAMRSRPPWKNLVHRALLTNFKSFIAIGQSSRRFFLDRGVDEKRIFVAPYCVENERFAVDAPICAGLRARFRERSGILRDATVFGFVGKLQPKKRVLDFLRAAAFARPHVPGMQLLIVGTGEQEAQARQFASEHGLDARFAGFVNQSAIVECYAAMDTLVLPSDDGETWGLVVNEAMNCGVPPIVSDRVGCGPDLVIERRTGLRFPFGDTEALADAMRLIGSNRALRESMAAECRAHVASFSIEKAAAATAMALVHAAQR